MKPYIIACLIVPLLAYFCFTQQEKPSELYVPESENIFSSGDTLSTKTTKLVLEDTLFGKTLSVVAVMEYDEILSLQIFYGKIFTELSTIGLRLVPELERIVDIDKIGMECSLVHIDSSDTSFCFTLKNKYDRITIFWFTTGVNAFNYSTLFPANLSSITNIGFSKKCNQLVYSECGFGANPGNTFLNKLRTKNNVLESHESVMVATDFDLEFYNDHKGELDYFDHLFIEQIKHSYPEYK